MTDFKNYFVMTDHVKLYLHDQLHCIFALKIVGWKLKGIVMVSKLQSH